MGGNVWIAEEEVVFWEEIAVHASCHGSIAIAEPKSWKELSVIMRGKMTSRLKPGEVLRRKYTPTSCRMLNHPPPPFSSFSSTRNINVDMRD